MPPTRDNIFQRISVDHVTLGGTRVNWELSPNYILPDNHSFQLQVADSPVSDNWIDVGSPVTYAFYAVDDDQRNFGQVQSTHYRVQLTTTAGEFYSNPAHTFGLLRPRDWRLVRAIIRKERLQQTHFTSPAGFLLKRKWVGERPAATTFEVDPLTNEPLKSRGSSTLGTEFVGGYYTPVPFYVELSPEQRALDQGQTGTSNPAVISGKAVAYPQVNSRDVWVNAGSDVRYEIRKVEHAAELRGIPITVNLMLAQIARTDPVYTVAMPS